MTLAQEFNRAHLERRDRLFGKASVQDVRKCVTPPIVAVALVAEAPDVKEPAPATFDMAEFAMRLASLERVVADVAKLVAPEIPLSEAPAVTTKRRILSHHIRTAVCSYYGVSTAELDGPYHDTRCTRPRHVAMYLCRKLTPLGLPAIARAFNVPKLQPGPAPVLKWIKVTDLVIDPTYQRDILEKGSKNIVRIAREFQWAKFSTIIVASAGDKFVIVDGQHRATAAALRNIDKVPCQVITASQREQAAAFAAINSVTTAMSPMQVHAAKVAAGDPKALKLNEVCARVDVVICRYPIPAYNMKVGQTLAAAQLARFLDKYGEPILELALRCITKTHDGNPGLVRAPLVEAFCAVLEAEPEWSGAKLLRAINRISLRDTLNKANSDSKMSRGRAVSILIDMLGAHLEAEFSTAKAA